MIFTSFSTSFSCLFAKPDFSVSAHRCMSSPSGKAVAQLKAGTITAGKQGALLSESYGAQSKPRGKKGFLKHPVVFSSVPSG